MRGVDGAEGRVVDVEVAQQGLGDGEAGGVEAVVEVEEVDGVAAGRGEEVGDEAVEEREMAAGEGEGGRLGSLEMAGLDGVEGGEMGWFVAGGTGRGERGMEVLEDLDESVCEVPRDTCEGETG